MRKRGKTAAREIAVQERRRHALELRKQGFTFEAIGAALECATSHAHRLVTDAIAAIPREAAKEVRDLELARLDAMMAGLWPMAEKGDPAACRTVIWVMRRRAAMLGLDAPKQTEIWGASEPFDVDKALG